MGQNAACSRRGERPRACITSRDVRVFQSIESFSGGGIESGGSPGVPGLRCQPFQIAADAFLTTKTWRAQNVAGKPDDPADVTGLGVVRQPAHAADNPGLLENVGKFHGVFRFWVAIRNFGLDNPCSAFSVVPMPTAPARLHVLSVSHPFLGALW